MKLTVMSFVQDKTAIRPLAHITSAPFLAIMVDETTSVSNKEQLVLCYTQVGGWWSGGHDEVLV